MNQTDEPRALWNIGRQHDLALTAWNTALYGVTERGERKKEGSDDAVPGILEPQGGEKIFRRNWARLIQKIYEVDPLVCPKC